MVKDTLLKMKEISRLFLRINLFFITFIYNTNIVQQHFKIEPLEEEELQFMNRRYQSEYKVYIFGMRALFAIALIIPFFVILIYYILYDDMSFIMQVFGYALCSTLSLCAIAAFASYRRSLYFVKKDLKEQTKLVETTIITEKKYMALNNTWHFYTLSPVKYSIEVNEDDYNRYEVNQEINLEYSRYAKEYFGYF